MMYGIKLSANRFINWCDKCWYETIHEDFRPFTLNEALETIQTLTKHFQYHVTLVSDDGEVQYDFGKKRVPKVVTSNQQCCVALGDYLLF